MNIFLRGDMYRVRIMPNFRIIMSILFIILLYYCVDAKCDSSSPCQNYFCPPATSQKMMRASGRISILDVSPPKQSDDSHDHQYLPKYSQRDQPPHKSEEAKPITLPSCLISVFILFATLSKIGLHVQVQKTASIFPLVLVSLLGSLIGGLILSKSHSNPSSWDQSLSLSAAAEKYSLGIVYLSILFLLFLLPRVISLEKAAVYKLTILLLSSLIFYQVFGSTTVTILHCLLLTSIVLPCNAIPLFLFSKHVQTSSVFYCMISQESLLSNAISLILYHLISVKSDAIPVSLSTWHSSVICVLAVGIEGTLFTYFLSSLLFTLTKYCSSYIVCIVEAIALLIISILAYFTVHFFQLPLILELTLCGICLRQYVDATLLSGSFVLTTTNGQTKITSLLKLLACICESGILALVFVSLPEQIPTMFSSSHNWISAFILLSVFIGINFASLGLICICCWSNNHWQPGLFDHFIVYCSALRGLYAFSLALLLGESDLPQKHIMVMSLFAFIFFAVFVQNLTLKVLQHSHKEGLVSSSSSSSKQELISAEKLKNNLLDRIFNGFKDVTDLFGYHILREGLYFKSSVLFRNFLMRDHDVPSPSDRRIRLLQLVRKLNLRTWLQHVTAYGGAGSSSSANTSTPSLPPPATAAAIGAFTCAQASLTISSAGNRGGGNGTGLQQRQSAQHSHSQSNIGHHSTAVLPGQRKAFHQKIWGSNPATEFHSKSFVPPCAGHERCCGEDSGVMVDDHSEDDEEEEDGSHITSSSALGACCGSTSCTGVEGTKFADDCRIHHIVDHNAYRPRHKWSKLNKKHPGSRQSNYAIFHQELCMQLEKLCSNRPSKKDNEEDGQKLSCVDHLRKCDVEGYLKNINEEIDDPSSRYLLTTPKQQRDVSPTGSDEEGDKLEQVAEVETAGLKKDKTEDAEDSLGFHYRLPWLDETHSSTPPLHPLPPVEETLAEKTLPWKCYLNTTKAPIAEAEEIETEQTLAETTLPWKRQSAREPISAAMSLNVVEDEPRAAEVPSWINNLLYHRLKETGSPYLSPEDTLTLVQNTVSRPSIFSVFPSAALPSQAEGKEKDSTSVTTAGKLLPPPLAAEAEPEQGLPLPWERPNTTEHEPLTSPHATNTNIGDKVCSVESMHRLLPPTHHIIIPLTPGNTNESISDLESAAAIERGALRSPASAPNFPTHWQMLLPSLRDRRHSTSLTEEQAYEEDCLQRVQNWLDNVEPGLDGVVDLDNFEEQHFFLLDDEDQLDDTYDADLEDEDLEETIV